ncbi:ABC transporter ATP-binding protein [Kineosporia sp. NBRC 101731]|uniref:ABC transporter ATP-binding protein n=1 Tax=Kineosporia sp. NBRC 101731 TaxID=3032199 RepID=UPI0024A03300|nr:ABC transporter ATP-binding protein [Kineosporia sp. NBRC 101731]GLY29640.1 dipeptide/oligopeptide/nickel ABC transporter ATP-binding protein [Kineosporia sp. NBRC 101731]
MTATEVNPPPTETAPPPALRLDDVRVELSGSSGRAQILRGVSFEVPRGQIVALAGESGSGKSTAMLAAVRLLPWGAGVTGTIECDGQDVRALSSRQLRQFRARTARVIFQDPWSSLHPMRSVGQQLVESARSADPSLPKVTARALAMETLHRVGIPDPEARMDAYPHQISGGQLQRVMIAMALVARPSVLLCDEPTTALDVTTQAQILDLLRDLNRSEGITVLIATHDLDVISGIADRLVVMYAGRVVEDGPAQQVLSAPQHLYTWSLLQAAPAHQHESRLRPIEGRPPRSDENLPGCAFAPRCPAARDDCTTAQPGLELVATGHRSACLPVQQKMKGEHR